MKTSDCITLLQGMIGAKQNALLTGAPGIGKSDIVAQAATLAKHDLIISHPVVSDPTDAKGLPWVAPEGDHATFLPFGDLYRALNADMPTVWFLDDLGQATPATQASYMQLLLARRINGHALPEHITFVAATNRRTDRAGVSGILEPVKSRFVSIINVEANLDDWTNWALSHDIKPELIAFLRFRTPLLHEFSATQDLVNQPCPRTWHHVNKLLSLKLPASIELQAIMGAVGEGPAGEFVAFLRVYRDLPNLDEILLDPSKAPIPKEMNALYAVATGLASKVTEANFPRVATYAERMNHAGRTEHGVLLLKDCIRRNRKLCNTQTFIKLCASDIGKLISGD